MRFCSTNRRLSPRRAREARDDADQALDIERLGEVVGESRGEALLHIEVRRTRRQRHNRDRAGFARLREARARLEPAHAGQIDIHQNQCGLERHRHLDAGLGIVRGRQTRARQIGEDLLHHDAALLAVGCRKIVQMQHVFQALS